MASAEIKDDDALEAFIPLEKMTKMGYYVDEIRREIEITEDNVCDWALCDDPWFKNMHGITGVDIQREEQVYPAALSNELPVSDICKHGRQIADVPTQFASPYRFEMKGERGDVKISKFSCKDTFETFEELEECMQFMDMVCEMDRSLRPGDVVVIRGVNIYKLSLFFISAQWVPALSSPSDPNPIPMPAFMNGGKSRDLSTDMARKLGILE